MCSQKSSIWRISKVVSNDNKLNTIYDRVYEKLKKLNRESNDDIFTLEKGRLYRIISEILEESAFEDPQEKTSKICNAVNIEKTNSPSDDSRVVQDLSKIFTERQITPKIRQGIKNIITRFNQNPEDSMKWFVVAACMLVGVYACLQYLEGRKNQAQNRQSSSSIPASLCLVVQASEVSSLNITLGSSIDGRDLKSLFEYASYFLCERKSEAEKIEEGLVFSDEEIPRDSPKEVYVRIAISDGKPMINKTIRYEIKENIEDSQQYKVEKLKCLWSLSGLESFTRI